MTDESLTATDRLDVQELIATYNWAMDAYDADLLVSTYIPDGVFVGGAGTFTGHDELREQVAMQHHANSQQFTSNYTLRREGDAILASCYCIIVVQEGEKSFIQISGYYHDRIVRHDGRWRFASRRFQRFSH
jgi:uncharacterized protein (TIGR02246 family)